MSSQVVHAVLFIDTQRVHDIFMLYIRIGEFLMLRGILLLLEGDKIRVALEECGDAAEFRRVGNGWLSEEGESVDIEWQPAPRSDLYPLPFPAAMDRSSRTVCSQVPARWCVV